MSKFGTKEKCAVCTKSVYPDDRIVVDNKLMHATCFRCTKCNTRLTLGNFTALEGTPYCKPHFKEAFKLKGKYDFGGKTAESGEQSQTQSAQTETETSTPPSSGPPPPPAGGPPPVVENTDNQKSAESSDDLFASINQLRDNAGSGLRKVAKEEKTKYRSEEEKVSVVPDTITPAKSVAAKGKKASGPPKFELVSGFGEKWVIENQDGQQLEVTDTKTKQGVYIFNCNNTYITVKGKVNNIILDSCKKSGVILDDAVASVEMVNCQSVKVQVVGSVPTVNVDKTDGVVIYLSEASINTTIITSKSSEMNVCVPGATEDDDSVEVPLPEQYQHKYNPETKKLETEMVSLNL
ncbi:cyclase-associated protein 1 [Acrasis kona]|uniref:Cyclase-associated protein 1 n=1 Tax=Acrasis kona TaxID=1008807 RepID=A0AAW2ZRM1_9EUKA